MTTSLKTIEHLVCMQILPLSPKESTLLFTSAKYIMCVRSQRIGVFTHFGHEYRY